MWNSRARFRYARPCPAWSRRLRRSGFRRESETVTISGIFEEVGPAWVLLLVVLFVGVVYWAFRPRRPRPGDDDPVQ